MQQDVRETAERLSEHGKLENGTVNAVKSFYRHLQSKMVQHSPTATDSASHPLRRTPLVPSSIMSAVPSRNTDMSKIESPSHPTQVTSSNSIEQVKPTFLVEAKGVSRNLMKAIVKPTVSHIADAYNKLEVWLLISLRSPHLNLSDAERFIGCESNTENRSIKDRYGYESSEKCRLRLRSRLW
jgi:hypothetical protein